jgi:lipopolysaccharide export system protein LptA
MFLKNKNIRKQLDTIVDPSNKPYYCGSDCNFKWKGNVEISRGSVEISSDQVKETKKVKKKVLKC